MKAAIITARDPTYKKDIDGNSIVVRNVSQQLSRLGHQVDIFTPLGDSSHKYDPKKASYQATASTELFPGVLVTRFNLEYDPSSYDETKHPFLKRIDISAGFSSFFSDNKLNEYDVIKILHVCNATGFLREGLAPLEKTVLFPLMIGKFYQKYLDVPQAYIDNEKWILTNMHHIQTNTKDEASAIHNDYGVIKNSVFVIPPGYNPEIFKPTRREKINKDNSINVICANMVRQQKGQHHFVSIVEQAKKRGIELKIHIVGVNGDSFNEKYNEYANDFLRNVSEKGLNENFVFYGELSQEKLAKVMEQCQIAIYPSISETFGQSLLESMVTGLPTIAFDDVGAYRDFLKHKKTGLLVPRSEEAVASQIEELIDDQALYFHISEEGIKVSPRLTWEATIDRMISVYKDRGALDNLS